MAFAVGIAPPRAECNHDAMLPTTYMVTSPAWVNATAGFYAAATRPLGEAAQIAAIRNFAEKLLREVVEPPQAALDLLDERFWDLVG